MAKDGTGERAQPRRGELEKVYSAGLETHRNRLYAVTHVKRDAPEKIIVKKISAPNETLARALAASLLGNVVILHIRPEENPELAAQPRPGYPNARFIHGRFLAGAHADEALLLGISD
ncbi:MAG TPA: hypothetical protein ENI72_03285 [Rhodospirillales bacterium]|nr:hypothetical protein [Rhodospirillales bacterium]